MTVPVRPASPAISGRVPAGALFEPGSEGLADGRQAAASGKGSDQHEEGEDLRNDAERRLNGGIQPSCHPQIRHGNGKMTQHHAELRHGEGNEFPAVGRVLFGAEFVSMDSPQSRGVGQK